jgi:ComF family protein
MVLSKIKEIIDFIYPQFCKSCNKRLEIDEECFCSTCFNKIEVIHPPYCSICGISYPQADENFICGHCLNEKSKGKLIFRAIGKYDGVLKEAIHIFKYKKRKKLGMILAKFFIKNALENEEIKRNIILTSDAIIPVPLHKSRLREREYNQSEILANELSKYTGLPVVPNWLVRVKHTLPQSTLSKEQRERNVKGVFSVKQNMNIKRIILVDDIITTGATAKECANVLFSVGVEEIKVLALSRAM